MKKNYILPEISFINANPTDIISNSPVGIGENENDNIIDVSEW